MKRMLSIQKYITLLCLFILVLLCVPTLAGTRRRCNTEQYWHTLFVKCMPCKEICKPPDRSLCQSNCPDFFRSLTACSTEQYWENLFGSCFNCTVICNPPSRDKCKEKCSGYIESLEGLTTATQTVHNHTTDQTLTTVRWITDHVSEFVFVALIMTIAIIIGLCCYRSKIAQCARKHFTCRDDKMPIEETGNRDCQSNYPLVERRQDIV